MHEFASFLGINSKPSPDIASESSDKNPIEKSQYGQEFHRVFNKIADGSLGADPKLPERYEQTVPPNSETEDGVTEYQAVEGSEIAMRPRSGKDLPQLALHQRALAAGRIVLTTAESKVSDVSMTAFMGQQVIAGYEMMEDPASIADLSGFKESKIPEGGRNQAINELDVRNLLENIEVKPSTPETANKLHLEEKKTSQVLSGGPGSTKPEALKSSSPVLSDLDLDQEFVADLDLEKIDGVLAVTENRKVDNDLKVHHIPDARIRTASTADVLSEHGRLSLIKSHGLVDQPSLNQRASPNLDVEADSMPLRRDAAENFEKDSALFDRRMSSEVASQVREGVIQKPEIGSISFEKGSDLPLKQELLAGDLGDKLRRAVEHSQDLVNQKNLAAKSFFTDAIREPIRSEAQLGQQTSPFVPMRGSVNRLEESASRVNVERSASATDVAADLGDKLRRAVEHSQDLVNQKNLAAKSFFTDAIREPIRSEAQLGQQTSPSVPMRESDNRLKESASGVSVERSTSAAELAADFKAELRTVLRNVQAGLEMVSADSTKNYEIWSERLAHTVASRIQAMIASNNWQLSLRLDPPSLGEIRVELQMSESGIEGRLSATDEVTRQLLQDGLQKLKIAMRDMLEPGQGINLLVKKDSGNDSQKNDRQEKSSEISDELDIISEVASEFASGKEPGQGILDILV